MKLLTLIQFPSRQRILSASNETSRTRERGNRRGIIDDSSYRQNGNRSSQCEIVNLARANEDKLSKGEKFISLELFPSKNCDSKVYESFFSEFSRHCSPLFYALTWHDEPESDDTFLPLEILRGFPSNTLLHVAANNSKKVAIVKTLNYALAQGKTNVFALRGDGCSGTGDFAYASDLVKFLRSHYCSNFTICVAGYPQMHPESSSKETDLRANKQHSRIFPCYVSSASMELRRW